MKRQLDILKENTGQVLTITMNNEEKEYFIATTFLCTSQNIKIKKNRYNLYLISNLFSQIADDYKLYEISSIKNKHNNILYSRKLHGSKIAKLKEKKLLKTKQALIA